MANFRKRLLISSFAVLYASLFQGGVGTSASAFVGPRSGSYLLTGLGSNAAAPAALIGGASEISIVDSPNVDAANATAGAETSSADSTQVAEPVKEKNNKNDPAAMEERIKKEIVELRGEVKKIIYVKNKTEEEKAVLQKKLDNSKNQSDAVINNLNKEIRKKDNLIAAADKDIKQRNAELTETQSKLSNVEREKEELSGIAKTLTRIIGDIKKFNIYNIIGGLLILSLFILLAVLLLLRSRRRAAQLKRDIDAKLAREQKRRTSGDWLLVGKSGRLKLNGALLAEGERGTIVGRGQSDADVIIDDKNEGVSRRHARFFLRNGELHIEDLRALNGTFVNGKRLDAGEVRKVAENVEIGFASFVYSLQKTV